MARQKIRAGEGTPDQEGDMPKPRAARRAASDRAVARRGLKASGSPETTPEEYSVFLKNFKTAMKDVMEARSDEDKEAAVELYDAERAKFIDHISTSRPELTSEEVEAQTRNIEKQEGYRIINGKEPPVPSPEAQRAAPVINNLEEFSPEMKALIREKAEAFIQAKKDQVDAHLEYIRSGKKSDNREMTAKLAAARRDLFKVKRPLYAKELQNEIIESGIDQLLKPEIERERKEVEKILEERERRRKENTLSDEDYKQTLDAFEIAVREKDASAQQVIFRKLEPHFLALNENERDARKAMGHVIGAVKAKVKKESKPSPEPIKVPPPASPEPDAAKRIEPELTPERRRQIDDLKEQLTATLGYRELSYLEEEGPYPTRSVNAIKRKLVDLGIPPEELQQALKTGENIFSKRTTEGGDRKKEAVRHWSRIWAKEKAEKKDAAAKLGESEEISELVDAALDFSRWSEKVREGEDEEGEKRATLNREKAHRVLREQFGLDDNAVNELEKISPARDQVRQALRRFLHKKIGPITLETHKEELKQKALESARQHAILRWKEEMPDLSDEKIEKIVDGDLLLIEDEINKEIDKRFKNI